MAKKIIAIVGMCGAGKSVACDFFKAREIPGLYFGGFTMEQLEKQGLPINPENEKKVREALRAEHGMAAFAVLALEKITALQKDHDIIFIDGLYSFEEFELLDEKFPEQIILVEIYTNKSLRYQRLSQRPHRPLTPKEAKARDLAELKQLNKGGPIALSDFKLENNGSVEEMNQKLEWLMGEIR